VAAVPKPQPKDWLAAAADELRQGDRATLTLLQESYRNINEILKELPDTPDAAFGNLIYRAQLERTRRELLSEQAKLFDKLGDTVSARRLRSASRAAKLSAAANAALLHLVGQDGEGQRLFAGATITAQRTVETLLARAKLSAVPLSERIYKTSAWMHKRLDTLIVSTMAKGLNAQRFAKVARDWFSPSVPGGTRYAAMRLARTEINNAFHATSISYAQDKPWVSQMDWNLSKSHPKRDKCNVYAEASPWDVHTIPPKPHPQCMCYVTEVTPDEDEWIDRFVAGEFDDYLDGELAKADTQLGIKPEPVVATPQPIRKITPATADEGVNKVTATTVKAGDEITVKGTRMVVGSTWYEGRFNKPGAKRMTNMVGFQPVGSSNRDDIIWVAAHVKVIKHESKREAVKDNGRDANGAEAARAGTGATGRQLQSTDLGGAGQPQRTSPEEFDRRVAAAETDSAALAVAPWGLDRPIRERPPQPEWRRAFSAYTGEWYRDINGFFRGGKIRAGYQELVEGYIKDMADAYAAMPESEREFVTYRGMRNPKLFGDRVSNDMTGLEWEEESYVSTAGLEKRAMSFTGRLAPGVLLRILVPKGQKVLEASEERAEAEMLLDRGTRFRIVRDNGVNSTGVRLLDVELIPSK
jgi:hypothetical protein